jgi:L-2-hydroxyglutarate oxidase
LGILYQRGQANGVKGLLKVGPERIKEIEPYARGVSALLSPATGIVDYQMVARSLAREFEEHGGDLHTGAEVTRIRRTWETLSVETTIGDLETSHIINCAGLYSDVIARMMGARADVKVIPFRGEYYFLRPERRHLVQNLIYPVPDPAFPFLGVHFTRTIHGEVEAGPNAVLAFSREGYSLGAVNSNDLLGTLRFPGAWSMARRHWRTGAGEFYRSLNRKAFVRALQRLLPDIREEDIGRGGAGVRAQAVDRKGNLLDDFRIDATPRAIHIINAPSPAATSSLAIGGYVADLAAKDFRLGE